MGVLSTFPAGGGAKLNIKAYAATGDLPASAAAGAVAAITPTAIGSAFAGVTAPALPANGDVWIWIGVVTRAPVALTDKITLSAVAVYQRISGAWVLKPAYVYTGSAWVEITTYLYKDGADLLGPFQVQALSGSQTVFSKEVTGMKFWLKVPDTSSPYIRIATVAAIDVTNMSLLRIEYNVPSGITTAHISVASEPGGGSLAQADLTRNGVTNVTNLDVSAIDGLAYVRVYMYVVTSYANFVGWVYKVWFER